MKALILKLAGLARYLKKWLKPGSGKFKLTLWQRLSVFFYGFIPDAALLYDLKKHDRKDYLTDLEMYTKAILINTGYTELINNKLAFTDYMRAFVSMPATAGYFHNGRVVPLETEGTCVPQEPMAFFQRHMQDEMSYMIKKFDAGSGEGIYRLTRAGDSFLLNGKMLPEVELVRRFGKLNNYMISEFVDQADYAKRIYAPTVNTVKFITMIDPDTQKAFLAACFHRFGTNRSFPVDNIGKGSCLAHVDIDTGLMSPVYLVRDRKLLWIEAHPDTGEQIEGVYIPGYESVKQEILLLHNKIKYITYIAWDIVIQNDGFILLEGNANTDMAGIQLFGPFLCDPRVRRFYQYHHVIKR